MDEVEKDEVFEKLLEWEELKDVIIYFFIQNGRIKQVNVFPIPPIPMASAHFSLS